MRNRRPSPEHEQAVARRLAALSSQWEQAREDLTRAGTTTVPAWDDEPGDWSWEEHTQVRGVVAPLGDGPAVGAGAVEAVAEPAVKTPVEPVDVGAEGVREPGRHAARRPSVTALRSAVGAGTSGLDRVGLRLAHLVWVAVFAAVALAATSWWLVRAKESVVVTPVAAPVASPSSAPAEEAAVVPGSPGGSGAGAAPVGTPQEVVVDVAGKVRRPGIVVLPQGSRVVDALESAGGARRGVDLQSLNLARVLVDGEQIIVGAPAPASGAGTAAPGSPPGSSSGAGLVNLNQATQSQLEALPGVGPVTASAIVDWRTTHGGFSSVEDLLEVHGIGEVTLERLGPLVTV